MRGHYPECPGSGREVADQDTRRMRAACPVCGVERGVRRPGGAGSGRPLQIVRHSPPKETPCPRS